MTTVFYKDPGGVVRSHEITHASDVQEAVGKGIFSLTPGAARQVIPLEESLDEKEVVVEEPGEVVEELSEDELVEAARRAIAHGDITVEGKPLVEAMEQILGRGITAKERDDAWEKLPDPEGK